MPVRLVVAGCNGRMSGEIISAAAGDPEVEVVGGTARRGTKPNVPFAVADDPATLLRDADAIVSFTTPEATIGDAHAAAEAGKAAVIGTTGLSAAQVEELRALATRAPILWARNMSVGVNALLQHLPALASALQGYDVEITEAHHRHKKDAPSGTALALGEAVAGGSLSEKAVHGRSGIQPRQPGEIGFHAIRAGGNAGEHWVLFADEGEQIQIVHRAYGRRTFALGALRAAKWTVNQPAGFYSMADVLRG